MHAASSSTSVIAGSSQAGTAGPRGRAHGIGSRSRSGVRTPTRRLGRCHFFTLREARRHWTMMRGHDADHAAEIAALVDRLEPEARARGWVDPQRYLATAPRSADAPAL